MHGTEHGSSRNTLSAVNTAVSSYFWCIYIKTGEWLPVKPEQTGFSLPASSIFIPDWTLRDSVFH